MLQCGDSRDSGPERGGMELQSTQLPGDRRPFAAQSRPLRSSSSSRFEGFPSPGQGMDFAPSNLQKPRFCADRNGETEEFEWREARGCGLRPGEEQE